MWPWRRRPCHFPEEPLELKEVVKERVIDVLSQRSVNFSLKIVVFDDGDIDYAKSVFSGYPHVPQKFLQPGNARVHDQGDISSYLLNRLEWPVTVVEVQNQS